MRNVLLGVYGTLRMGQNAHSFLKGAQSHGLGKVQGSIWCSGSYPCYVRNPDPPPGVIVELYEATPEMIRLADRYEGYDKGDIQGSLFIRIPVREQITGKLVFIYEWNGPIGGRSLIESGDFVEWINQQRLKMVG